MDLKTGLEIEARYNLADCEIDGYPFWNFFRFEIYCNIETALELEEFDAYSSSGFLNKLIGRVYNIINPGFYKKKKCDYLFVSVSRRVKENGIYLNPYVDPIMSGYDNSLLLELPSGGKHIRPAASKNVIYGDRSETIGEIIGVVNKVFKTRSYRYVHDYIVDTVNAPLEEMCRSYGVSLDWTDLYNRMTRYYYVYRHLKRYYDKLINYISPKVLIVVCSYGRPQMIMIELCKLKGIATVELQHGTCGIDDSSYNYPGGKEIKNFPDYILLFSEYWKHRASFPISQERVIPVGFPYGEMRVSAIKKSVTNSKKTVLFLSTGKLGTHFSQVACRFDTIIDKDSYRIVYKMHPAEYNGWRERYKELGHSEIEVVNNSECDLYELLNDASYIVAAGGTTALYEGMQFDARVFVYLFSATAEAIDLCERGVLQGFYNADELLELIEQDDSHRKTEVLWMSDSLNNTRNAIDSIVISSLMQ